MWIYMERQNRMGLQNRMICVGRGLQRWFNFNSLDRSRDIFHQTKLLRVPSNPTLNMSRGGSIYSFSGQPVFTTLTVKTFFLASNLTQSHPPHVLSLAGLLKGPSSPFLDSPSGTGVPYLGHPEDDYTNSVEFSSSGS